MEQEVVVKRCRCNVTLPKAERFRFNGTEADLKW
jgi:hypothetical protein